MTRPLALWRVEHRATADAPWSTVHVDQTRVDLIKLVGPNAASLAAGDELGSSTGPNVRAILTRDGIGR